jgi:hypothetical protein
MHLDEYNKMRQIYKKLMGIQIPFHVKNSLVEVFTYER